MTELSHDAKRVLASYRATQSPTPEREAEAYRRLRAGLATTRNPSGPVVTAGFRRRRQARMWLRTARRGVVTGLAVFAVIWFMDRGVPELSSQGMLEDAAEYLEMGDAETAYNILVQHSRRFPTRGKAEARMGLVVDALCGMERPQRARMELERYLVRVPESAHADRILDPCEGILEARVYEPREIEAPGFAPPPYVLEPDHHVEGSSRPATPDWMPADDQFGTSVRADGEPELGPPSEREH